MARKTKQVIFSDDNRDKGKIFLIKEMSATQAENWAVRAFFAMTKSGVEVPDEFMSAGMAGIAAMGFKALGNVNADEALILLEEMFSCVRICPDPNHVEVVRDLVEDDIEEIITRLKLRMEVFELHVGFSIAERISALRSKNRPALEE